MLWETGGKGFLLHGGRKLSRIFPAVMWKAELVNDEIQHLVEISKLSVEGVTQFFLLLTVECKRKDKLKQEFF